MRFYKIEGTIENKYQIKNSENRRAAREISDNIALLSRAFNEKRNGKSFMYVANILADRMTAGMICTEDTDTGRQTELFFKAIKTEPSDISTEEITFNMARALLRTSDRNGYINDDGEVFRDFGIDELTGRFSDIFDYGENLIENADKTDIYTETEKYTMSDSVLPELDRIYDGRATGKAKGHPVHYMMQTDDPDTRREICRLLLKALYANGRIENRRYCFVNLCMDESIPPTAYDQLYKMNEGGAVIIRYDACRREEDGDTADSSHETIERMCEALKKYRYSVLTIFCLPRECTKARDIFNEEAGSISFIELKEEFVSGTRAEEFLKMLAAERHIRTDKNLFNTPEKEKGYLAAELRELFDRWYDRKLKTGIYPQYRDIATAKHRLAAAAPKGSAYDELQEMIGLSSAKKLIGKALDYHKAMKLFADKGMKNDHPAMHMVFTGSPGTAKTSVARLFARIMKENGLLSKGDLIEVGRGDLVGKYVGWTAPTIQKKFREAEGSVLFIDEAYSLADDRDGSYGDEAINTIVQEMENRRESVIVIFAGYTDKMEAFLNKNPGLRSRIAYNVPFDDYTTEELCAIAALIAKKNGLSLDVPAQSRLEKLFSAARAQSDFGNGRYVRNVIERARMAQASRLLAMGYENVTSADVATLCASDIEMPEVQVKAEKRIGFSA